MPCGELPIKKTAIERNTCLCLRKKSGAFDKKKLPFTPRKSKFIMGSTGKGLDTVVKVAKFLLNFLYYLFFLFFLIAIRMSSLSGII